MSEQTRQGCPAPGRHLLGPAAAPPLPPPAFTPWQSRGSAGTRLYVPEVGAAPAHKGKSRQGGGVGGVGGTGGGCSPATLCEPGVCVRGHSAHTCGPDAYFETAPPRCSLPKVKIRIIIKTRHPLKQHIGFIHFSRRGDPKTPFPAIGRVPGKAGSEKTRPAWTVLCFICC